MYKAVEVNSDMASIIPAQNVYKITKSRKRKSWSNLT